MSMPQSEKIQHNPRYLGYLAAAALVHYTAICLYVYYWTRANKESTFTTVVFFIGLLAWFLLACLHLLFRKRDPVLARLSLFMFVTSLVFGLLNTPFTD